MINLALLLKRGNATEIGMHSNLYRPSDSPAYYQRDLIEASNHEASEALCRAISIAYTS